MPGLNFKTWLAPKILADEKPFTLRAPRKDGRDPKIGDMLYMFTAMRTKQCKKFAEKNCLFTAICRLHWSKIEIPGFMTITEPARLERFARLDGFDDHTAFLRFHEISGGDIKTMRLIAWVTRNELEALLQK